MRLMIYYTGDGETRTRATRAAEAVRKAFAGRVLVGLPPAERPIPPDATDRFRGASFADALLDRLGGDTAGLWFVEAELATQRGATVPGLAREQRGAVVSTLVLPTQGHVDREAIHEVGHVLGLRHCENDCAMRLPRSLDEADGASAKLCWTCEMKIRN